MATETDKNPGHGEQREHLLPRFGAGIPPPLLADGHRFSRVAGIAHVDVLDRVVSANNRCLDQAVSLSNAHEQRRWTLTRFAWFTSSL